jgi:hypothetical protein
LAALGTSACGDDAVTCTNHNGEQTLVCIEGHEPRVMAENTPSESIEDYSRYSFDDLGEPRLVHDERFVYWASGARELLRTDKESGETRVLVSVAPECGIFAVELAAGALFTAVNCRGTGSLVGSVWSHSIDDGAGTELYRATRELFGFAAAPDASSLYAIEVGDSGRVLVAIDPSTGTPTELTLEERVGALVAVPAYAYFGWSSYDTTDPPTLARVELATGALEKLLTLTVGVAALEAFGEFLYVRTRSSPDETNQHILWRTPLAEPRAELERVTDSFVPQWVTVSDTHAYGAGRYDMGGREQDSTIIRYRLSDGRAEPLIVLRVGFRPSGVVVDDTHVYWVDYDEPFQSGTSRLVRAAR